MAALPEELLLAVFAALDPWTLGLKVPLVCRRWRRVAADPRAWAGAVLDVVTDPNCTADGEPHEPCELCEYGTHGALKATLCVLRKAPALRKLDLSGVCNCERETDVLAALQRSRAIVQEMVLPCEDLVYSTEEFYEDAIGCFLSQSSRSLRALDVGLFLRSVKMERAVAGLKELQSLTVDLHQDFEPCGALQGALPRLARLEVTSDPEYYCNLNRRSGRGVARLLADLVGGAAGTLRELLLQPGMGPLPHAALAEARRCTGLRELHCDVEDLVLLPHLPALRTLELHLMRRRNYVDYYGVDDPLVDAAGDAHAVEPDDDDVAVLTSAADALLASGPLPSLSEISVSEAEYSLSSEAAVLVAAVGRLLEALAHVAPAATALRLRCPPWEDLSFAGILHRLPQLQCVDLSRCTLDTLDTLAALPNLQEVSVCVDVEPEAGRGSLGFDERRNEQRRERLEAAAAKVRAQRPAARWSLFLYR